jgi:site-specific recombinase XerD
LHDLIPLGPASHDYAVQLTVAEIDATMAYAAAEKSPATRACYARDFADFAAWCTARGACPLPAKAGIIAAYLSALAQAGRKASTIGRRAAAIGWKHKLAGCMEPPTSSEGVKAVLRGIRRTIGAAKQGKAPATADVISNMLALCPDTLRGKRDRALLAFGFAGAFRRSELCALEVCDLTETPDGLRVLIRRSKGDQEGKRSRFPEAIVSARSRRCRRGWQPPRSAAGRCSGPWRAGGRFPMRRSPTTAHRGS